MQQWGTERFGECSNCARNGNAQVKATFFSGRFCVSPTQVEEGYFCSFDCFRLFLDDYEYCNSCKVWMPLAWQSLVMQVQGPNKDTKVCRDCFETTTLELGQLYVTHPENPTEVVAFLSQSHCRHANWITHGYMQHPEIDSVVIAREPEWEVEIDPYFVEAVKVAVSDTLRWSTWSLATGCKNVGGEVPMTLYVKPRAYHQEARAAALTFLLVVHRWRVDHDFDLPVELALMVSREVYHSSTDRAWYEMVKNKG